MSFFAEQETQDEGTRTRFLSWEVRLWPLLLIGGITWAFVSVATPNLLTSRSGNEPAAINTLRNLAFAQAECKRAGFIDVDRDGIGECGFFAELSGAVGVRQRNGQPSATDRVSPPVLSEAFGNVSESRITRSGYRFQVFLPGPAGQFVAEADTGGVGKAAPDPDRAETLWCAYAWPSTRTDGSRRVFFINQSGTILTTRNDASGQYYEGDNRPKPSAAFRKGSAGNISSPLAEDSEGMDGGVWKVIH